tara:strand:- start:1207 stop:1443 length:237 start_codon:yes stop_codon:yes gene_type:complete
MSNKINNFKISNELNINPNTNSLDKTNINNKLSNTETLSPTIYSPASIIETPSSLLRDDTINKTVWKCAKSLPKQIKD